MFVFYYYNLVPCLAESRDRLRLRGEGLPEATTLSLPSSLLGEVTDSGVRLLPSLTNRGCNGSLKKRLSLKQRRLKRVREK